MATQKSPKNSKSKLRRLPKGWLPEVTRSADIRQEHIDIWLEKSRKNRDYPGVQRRLAQLTAEYWQGRPWSTEWIMRDW